LNTRKAIFRLFISHRSQWYFQLCLHKGPSIDPEARDLADDSWVLERMKQYAARHFPGLEPTPHILESCIYTVLNNFMQFLV